jgi:hypothetical protein
LVKKTALQMAVFKGREGKGNQQETRKSDKSALVGALLQI